jgi:hypothetical protein
VLLDPASVERREVVGARARAPMAQMPGQMLCSCTCAPSHIHLGEGRSSTLRRETQRCSSMPGGRSAPMTGSGRSSQLRHALAGVTTRATVSEAMARCPKVLALDATAR